VAFKAFLAVGVRKGLADNRISQQRPVMIFRLIMQDSIEERILQLHHDKRDLASDLLEGAEVSARLGEDELLDLIRA